jgi:hypothetical protein
MLNYKEDIMAKHYIRIDSELNIIKGFSDDFEYPLSTDICIEEDGGRQFELLGKVNPSLTSNDKYIYKFVDDQVVMKTEEELSQLSIQEIEHARASKLFKVGDTCTNTIYSGIDVETSIGTKHFALTSNDQLNLFSLDDKITDTTTSVPYHADGELCRNWDVVDFKKIVDAARKYIFYHTTLVNHLNVWIRRSQYNEFINVEYSSSLPEDLQANFDSLINDY